MQLAFDSVNARPCIVWFTGLSGAGKTTIARVVKRMLAARGEPAFLLDGDVVRKGLSSDLGFSALDRAENLRRAAQVAALVADEGFTVLAAFITPTRADRASVREQLAGYSFIEAYVDTELAVAEARDSKGLYRRARLGEIAHFTGISAPFDVPESPDLRLETSLFSADELAALVVAKVMSNSSPDRPLAERGT
jgi:bifunctional enzyme CysN/CysC